MEDWAFNSRIFYFILFWFNLSCAYISAYHEQTTSNNIDGNQNKVCKKQTFGGAQMGQAATADENYGINYKGGSEKFLGSFLPSTWYSLVMVEPRVKCLLGISCQECE